MKTYLLIALISFLYIIPAQNDNAVIQFSPTTLNHRRLRLSNSNSQSSEYTPPPSLCVCDDDVFQVTHTSIRQDIASYGSNVWCFDYLITKNPSATRCTDQDLDYIVLSADMLQTECKDITCEDYSNIVVDLGCKQSPTCSTSIGVDFKTATQGMKYKFSTPITNSAQVFLCTKGISHTEPGKVTYFGVGSTPFRCTLPQVPAFCGLATNDPTVSPTKNPTYFPSYHPTLLPTTTLKPTQWPTKYPTPEPTPNPTRSPNMESCENGGKLDIVFLVDTSLNISHDECESQNEFITELYSSVKGANNIVRAAYIRFDADYQKVDIALDTLPFNLQDNKPQQHYMDLLYKYIRGRSCITNIASDGYNNLNAALQIAYKQFDNIGYSDETGRDKKIVIISNNYLNALQQQEICALNTDKIHVNNIDVIMINLNHMAPGNYIMCLTGWDKQRIYHIPIVNFYPELQELVPIIRDEICSNPTAIPTINPTNFPTEIPTLQPSVQPTTIFPTPEPTPNPTKSPTILTSDSIDVETPNPTKKPSFVWHQPSPYPTAKSTTNPTTNPTTWSPTSMNPTTPDPTPHPTPQPTKQPTVNHPTVQRTPYPTPNPTSNPTLQLPPDPSKICPICAADDTVSVNVVYNDNQGYYAQPKPPKHITFNGNKHNGGFKSKKSQEILFETIKRDVGDEINYSSRAPFYMMLLCIVSCNVIVIIVCLFQVAKSHKTEINGLREIDITEDEDTDDGYVTNSDLDDDFIDYEMDPENRNL